MTRLDAAVQELVNALREEMRAAIEPDPNRPDSLLSIEQARLAIGGVSRSMLYSEMAAGRVRSLKVGRRRLIPSSAIGELMKKASALAKANAQESNRGKRIDRLPTG